MERAQAWDAEQRTFRRQKLQTLQTIAEELRRVREVLEAWCDVPTMR
jgi:hypothetical protein